MSHAAMLALAVVALLLANANADVVDMMRGTKCVIPNGLEHAARAAFFQQCISENYGQGNETRCYPELGCFSMDYPWTSLLRPLPTPFHPREVDVNIYCYTRESKTRYNTSLWPQVTMGGCPFDPQRQTMLVTHGFIQNGNFSWLSEMKDNYLKAVDANVFLVDWGRGATVMSYLQGASNTRIAGAEIGRFVNFLISNLGLHSSKVHLIGHSLGAQVMSYAAKRIANVGHFTALEPAQPAFEGCDSTVRVTKTDADFVEVIHTNAMPFIPTMGMGMISPVGDVDFYMNGGLHQPGCPLPAKRPEIKSIKDLAKLPYDVVYNLVFCSHTRAYDYYIRVLQENCMIWGRRSSFSNSLLNAGTMGVAEKLLSKIKTCDASSCLPMGLASRHSTARGIFAATTHTLAPFCETNPEINGKIFAEIEGKSGKKPGRLISMLEKITTEDIPTAKSGISITLKNSLNEIKKEQEKNILDDLQTNAETPHNAR